MAQGQVHARAAGTEAQCAVDVRVVLFAIQDGALWVALAREGDRWRLPGATLETRESLDAAALRAMQAGLGAEHRYVEQLYSLAGDGGAPTVTVAYLGIADPTVPELAASVAAWQPVQALPQLPTADARIIDYAVVRLRAKLGYTTIAFHLLPVTFSLSELQQVYETVLGQQLDKRNFRRRIQSAEILEATEETRREGSHRPARLFRFRAAHDADTYLTPAWVSAPDGESGKT